MKHIQNLIKEKSSIIHWWEVLWKASEINTQRFEVKASIIHTTSANISQGKNGEKRRYGGIMPEICCWTMLFGVDAVGKYCIFWFGTRASRFANDWGIIDCGRGEDQAGGWKDSPIAFIGPGGLIIPKSIWYQF